MLDILNVLSRVVGSAIGKVIGSQVSTLWDRNRLNSKLDKLTANASSDVAPRLEEIITASQALRLCELIESDQVGRVVQRAVMATFLGDRKREVENQRIEVEFRELIRLAFSGSEEELASEAIELMVAHVHGVVAEYMIETRLIERAPKSTLAELIPPASARIDAGRRNANILETLANLSDIDQFAKDMCQQVLRVHGKIRLPSSGSTRLVNFAEVFVQARVRDESGTISLTTALQGQTRVVLLGDPGGGKSTLAQSTALELAKSYLENARGSRVPFIVVLREFVDDFIASRRTMVQYLEDLCRSPYGRTAPPNAIEYLMLNDGAFLILDGLDELIDVAMRNRLVDAIHGFVGLYPYVPILVTSRRIGYEEAPLDGELFKPYSLGSFDRNAVEQYSQKWFALDEETLARRKLALANAFLRESELVADLRTSPLMLALMCALYAAEGYIPRNRPDVYEKCSMMLFERWDKQRNIVARLPFDAHVRSAMFALAWWIYQDEVRQSGIERRKIVRFIAQYLHERRFESLDEAQNAANEFIDFCTGRAWVLTDVGSNPQEPKYGFTHRTFLEYFAAKQLTRHYPTADSLFEYLRPYLLRAENDLVAQISLQLLGANVAEAADDFLDMVAESAEAERSDSDSNRNLTSFAARCLSFIVPRPATVRAVTRLVFRLFEHDPGSASTRRATDQSPMYDVLLAATENLPTVASELERQILSVASADGLAEHVAALAVYPHQFARAKHDSLITADQDEFWKAASITLRRQFDAIVARTGIRPAWLKWYIWSRGSMSARQAFDDSMLHFFSANIPKWISIPTPAFGLLAHLSNYGQELRDELDLGGRILGDDALYLIKKMLATHLPWKLIKGEPIEDYEPSRFALAELWNDPRKNGLYALLAALLTDYLLSSRPGPPGGENPNVLFARARQKLFSDVTGKVFDKLSISEMPVPINVRGFLYTWLAGGARTCSRREI